MRLIRQNYSDICQQISGYCQQYGRDPASVKLIAVGKLHSVEKILDLAGAGQRDFGENYLQEALEKITHCQSAHQPPLPLEWHFIGHIQSRKCKDLAHNFSWVHTVESLKVAKKLSQNRQGSPLNICIQLNIDEEESKSGIPPAALTALADEISALPNLNLRGLMIIPKTRTNFADQREVFSRCRKLLQQLNSNGHNLDQLSMGMTGDMEAAIAEGATMVRIGTALFGHRPQKQT